MNELGAAIDSAEAGPSETLPAINRLLQILSCSLAQYVAQAPPWSSQEQDGALRAVTNLAADQRHYAKRTAALLAARGARPDAGTFPLEWMSLNDAGLSFVLPRVMDHHCRDIAAIQRIAEMLNGDPEARDLAREVLGNARAHAELLAAACGRGAS